MSAPVNPPFFLSKIRPSSELSKEQENYFIQLERVLQQTYQRTGGPVDAIDNIETAISTSNDGAAAQNFAISMDLNSRIDDLESVYLNDAAVRRTNFITISSNYTAAPGDDITAMRSAKVTLPPSIPYGSAIVVRNGDGSVITVTSDSKIKRRSSTSSIKSVRMGTSMAFTYNPERSEYVL